ncbi:GNAT family N-acetyltransferase [Rhodopseudomonas sp. BR0G17]|uniref:GNAT family N-acetyltransferase n=1 Tax=Rhodopseudomonas sp. BR0G17 TaxID=2269368 RepID=UPI0013E0231F|nr:GNAT family N-acetyltransferase [Rhodopseudomonas sp. BR0G17]NEW99401.1 GNAT family N-acetyltransferase [Rhodopseudomonas sp. BR0G17]
MLIRPATTADFDALRAIELAAFETLRAAGAVSGVPSASSDQQLERYLDHGLLEVACNHSGDPIGFCGGYIAERLLHIGEMDVHPNWQRQGVGRALLTASLDKARAQRLDGATLTTDRFAPFNAPFYAGIGFRPLADRELPSRLRAILDEEAKIGLDPARRVAMMLRF